MIQRKYHIWDIPNINSIVGIFLDQLKYLHISYFDTMRKMKGDAVRRN